MKRGTGLEEAIVLVIKYEKSNKAIQEKAVESFSRLLAADEKTTVEVAYRGSNEKVITALKSLLALAQ
jgi:hypothetical protein